MRIYLPKTEPSLFARFHHLSPPFGGRFNDTPGSSSFLSSAGNLSLWDLPIIFLWQSKACRFSKYSVFFERPCYAGTDWIRWGCPLLGHLILQSDCNWIENGEVLLFPSSHVAHIGYLLTTSIVPNQLQLRCSTCSCQAQLAALLACLLWLFFHQPWLTTCPFSTICSGGWLYSGDRAVLPCHNPYP